MNPAAGPYLDRRAELRLREDWLAEARADEGTLFLAMRQGAVLVQDSAGGSRIAFLGGEDARITAIEPDRLVLLGWYLQRRCILADLPAEFPEQPGERLVELRPLASELVASEAGLAAYARALNLWRHGHRYCGRCGTATIARRAGHARHCPACDQYSFPRLDPAVIVLVHDGERALLGRQSAWPPGRFSTIAGFVEPGETLEEAVRREVQEETGVAICGLAYHSSQPWPFPASLMVGFTARALPAVPVLHDGELEEAGWFSRAQLRSGAVLLPPPDAISRRLIDSWLRQAD